VLESKFGIVIIWSAFEIDITARFAIASSVRISAWHQQISMSGRDLMYMNDNYQSYYPSHFAPECLVCKCEYDAIHIAIAVRWQ